MKIYKTDKWEIISPRVEGEIVFWVRNPNYRKIVDAGHIVGEYSFKFAAQELGTYELIFDNKDEKCYIEIYYNSPVKMWDTGVIPP